MPDINQVPEETKAIPEVVITTTSTELKEAIGQAVTGLREDMQTALNESAQQTAEMLHQAVEVMQQATQTTETPPEPTVEKSMPETPTPVAIVEALPVELSEPVKVAIADQAQAEVANAMEVAKAELTQVITDAKTQQAAEAVTAPTVPLTPAEEATKEALVIKATHQPLNDTISLVKTQSLVTNAILFLIIIGLSVYIVFDKINQRNDQLTADAASTTLAPFSLTDLWNPPAADQAVVPDLSEQIIRKQKDSLDLQPFSDTNLSETIAKTIKDSDKIAGLVQAHVGTIKHSERISDRDAIAKAFLMEDIVPAVLAELPTEIQAMPQAEKFVKDKLRDIANCVKRLYNDKEFRR